jgi:uncharacterized membrane protein YgcG
MGVWALLAGCAHILDGEVMHVRAEFAGNEWAGAAARQWIALGSVLVQAGILTGFVVGPLLYPATMPAYKMAEMKTVSLVPVKPPVVVRKPVVVRETSSAAASEVRQVARGSAVAALRPALGNDETPKLIAVGDGGDEDGFAGAGEAAGGGEEAGGGAGGEFGGGSGDGSSTG